MERQTVAKTQKNATRVNHVQRQASGPSLTAYSMASVQSSIGNHALQRLVSSPYIQTKLQISTPGDPFEQEADRVADTVMRMPEPQPEGIEENEESKSLQAKPLVQRAVPLAVREDDEEEKVATKLHASAGDVIHRLCTECEEEKENGTGAMVQRQTAPAALPDEDAEEQEVQTKVDQSSSPKITPSLAQNIHAMNGGGSLLPDTTRAFFEPRFGADFSQVRVHTGTRAAQSAGSINAKAFTVGSNIAFGSGQYTPHSPEGQRLLAHELTHVVQQSGLGMTHGSQNYQRQGVSRNFNLRSASITPARTHIAREPDKPQEPETKKSTVKADQIKAAEKEVAQALTIGRTLHQKAAAMVSSATEVDLDLVDIVQAQGEAVEQTLDILSDSSVIAQLSDDQRKVVLGAASIELQMYIRNAEHLAVLNKNVSLEIPDNVTNPEEVEEELDRFANWHEEWITQNSYVSDLAGDLIVLTAGLEEKIEVNVRAAEQFAEYEQNLKAEAEALQKIDAEMDNFAKQISSLKTRGKIAKAAEVAEFILRLRRGGAKSPPKVKPKVTPKATPKVPKGGGVKGTLGSKTRKQLKKPKGQTKPKQRKQRKQKKKRQKCTDAEIAALNAAMHQFCNQPRSCSMQGDDCASATKKVAVGMACVRARTELQQKCFSPGDPGYETHMQQIAEASAALRNCEAVMSAKCK